MLKTQRGLRPIFKISSGTSISKKSSLTSCLSTTMLQRRKGEGSAASSWTKLARGRYTKWAQRTRRNFEVRLISTSRCKINMSRSSVRDQGRLLMILKSRTSKEQIALGKMACLPWTWRDTWIRIHIWNNSLMSNLNTLQRQMGWNLQIFKT